MKIKILNLKGHTEVEFQSAQECVQYLKENYPQEIYSCVDADASIKVDYLEIIEKAPNEIMIIPRMQGGSEQKVKILWLSRHNPLPSQTDIFYQKFGHDFILVQWSERVANAEHIMQLLKENEISYLVPVLPESIKMQLLPLCEKENIKILIPEMQLLHDCIEGETCEDFNLLSDTLIFDNINKKYRHYRFIKFKVLKEYKIITEDF